MLIASPYFVPGEDGMRLMKRARACGARVAVLTNSLAAADVPLVFLGYARYRPKMLARGIELYELKPGVKADVPSPLALFRSSIPGCCMRRSWCSIATMCSWAHSTSTHAPGT